MTKFMALISAGTQSNKLPLVSDYTSLIQLCNLYSYKYAKLSFTFFPQILFDYDLINFDFSFIKV